MPAARNEPCPCGSGKKYKKCCLGKDEAHVRKHHQRALTLGAILLVIAALLYLLVNPAAGKLTAGVAAVAVVAYLVLADPPTSKGGGSPGSINFGR